IRREAKSDRIASTTSNSRGADPNRLLHAEPKRQGTGALQDAGAQAEAFGVRQSAAAFRSTVQRGRFSLRPNMRTLWARRGKRTSPHSPFMSGYLANQVLLWSGRVILQPGNVEIAWGRGIVGWKADERRRRSPGVLPALDLRTAIGERQAATE